MFIINLTYTKSLDTIDQLFDEHVKFLEQYYDSGVFLMSGAKTPRIGGIILAKSEEKQALENIIKQDPFIVNQAATYEIIEFKPRRISKKFEHLKDILL